MKRTALVLMALVALLLGNPVSGEAHGGGHGHFGVGVVVGPGWGPWYPYPYYYPPAPVVIQNEQPIYLEPQPQEQQYWYFCNDPKGYYPYVKRCPGGWMNVVPTPSESGPEE